MRMMFFLFITMFLFTPPLFAQQSISDLHLKRFEKLEKGTKLRIASDPFSSGSVAKQDLSIEELVLNGTVINKGKNFALVSGHLIEEGDRIAGYRVSSISRDNVILNRLDQVYILPMGGGY